jgi:hypothetical protein
VICASACAPVTVTVYWLPAVTPDPMAPLYASVTAWPAANWNPPSPEKLPKPPGKPPEKLPEMVLEKLPENVLEKLPENVLEKLPDREKLRVKDVELKKRVKLNPAAATGLRVLLLCTRNTAAPAMQAGSANPLRFWLADEVVVVVMVERHPPLPGVTSNELIDSACDPVFWRVTKMELLESAALLISRLPWLVELMPWLVETTGMFGC